MRSSSTAPSCSRSANVSTWTTPFRPRTTSWAPLPTSETTYRRPRNTCPSLWTIGTRHRRSGPCKGRLPSPSREWAQGRTADADAMPAAAMQHVLDIHSEYLHPVAGGFLAELDLRAGGPALRSSGPRPRARSGPHRFMFDEPTPTLIEALLTAGARLTAPSTADHAQTRSASTARTGPDPTPRSRASPSAGPVRRSRRSRRWIGDHPVASVGNHPVTRRPRPLDHSDRVAYSGARRCGRARCRRPGRDQPARLDSRSATADISGSTSAIGEPNLTDRELDVVEPLVARYPTRRSQRTLHRHGDRQEANRTPYNS